MIRKPSNEHYQYAKKPAQNNRLGVNSRADISIIVKRPTTPDGYIIINVGHIKKGLEIKIPIKIKVLIEQTNGDVGVNNYNMLLIKVRRWSEVFGQKFLIRSF